MSSPPRYSTDKSKGRARATSSASPADSRSPKRGHENVDDSREGGGESSASASASGAQDRFSEDRTGSKKSKKTPLSCAECRRNCDRVFPCQSCTKRGCGEICPTGVLVSGKGTRFILANTEQLHAKIMQMGDRIRNLEEGLESLHASSSSSQPHPLLKEDLLSIRRPFELYGNIQTGSTSQTKETLDREDAARTDSSSEDSHSDALSAQGHSVQKKTTLAPERLPGPIADLEKLSQSFPLPLTISPEHNLALRRHVRDDLPPRDEALYLWEQTRRNAIWQFNPHSNDTSIPNLVNHVYDNPLEGLSSRRLALLCMILAVGCNVDLAQPAHSADGERYHQLSRLALSDIPVMEDTNMDVILTLFYMTWYLLVFSDKPKAASHAWGLMGLNVKLAQSIGLHRDDSLSKIIPEEDAQRRILFWELLYLDSRLSLSLGRPPALMLSHTDRKPSLATTASDATVGSQQFQEWKYSSYTLCLSPALSLLSTLTPSYTAVLELDKSIRDSGVPVLLQAGTGQHSRSLTMQQAWVKIALESTLVQVHRTFFTKGLSDPNGFTIQHEFAPSVVAVLRAACRTVDAVEALYHLEPELSVRFLCFWNNTFSAAVALCLLVCRAPWCILAPSALQGLERACQLFRSAKEGFPEVLRVKPALETMVAKARSVYTRWSDGEDTLPKPVSLSLRDKTSAHLDNSPSFDHAHPCLPQWLQEIQENPASTLPLSSTRPTSPVEAPGPLPTPTDTLLAPLAVESRIAVSGVNFEFGELDSRWNDQTWMAWI